MAPVVDLRCPLGYSQGSKDDKQYDPSHPTLGRPPLHLKTSVLEDSLSALTTAVRKVDEKVSDVELTSSRDMKEAERRLSSRIQAVTNDQGKAHEEASGRGPVMKKNAGMHTSPLKCHRMRSLCLGAHGILSPSSF